MSFFSVIASSKLAASALAVGALAVGGAGTAAYANALPDSAQQAAHNLIGAPSPKVSSAVANATAAADKAAPAVPSSPTLPSAPASLPSAPSLGGVSLADLCQTFVHGGLTAGSTGLTDLAAAAHGQANVTSFCSATLQSGAAAGSAQVGANVSVDADGSATLPSAPSLPNVPSVQAPALPAPAAGVADDAATVLHK
ncbi:protein tyrosine phosphatase [Sinomonas sp. ASV322]|uniref:protein tyrosine phosphatase n=1 Tax=Sinomonas sp. ASV322 TaxID=3041920 RepID=UPI0027DC0AF5|nr:protein tyrosine phosphatase [Sinomonas sp. ASV322]MDQ4503051.1 protein tyrosine phosphatase [Sinomonas sp. ASV322]